MKEHTCSYYCERPECIRAQRDELRDRLGRELAAAKAEAEALRDALKVELGVWQYDKEYGVSD